MSIDFSSDRLDDGRENLYLGYLRDSDEFRIAMAKYWERRSELDSQFSSWVLQWLVAQRRKQS